MAAGFGVQKPNVGGLGAGVRPTTEMAGMAKAGTARSGLQNTAGPFMALQNSPLGAQNFPHNPHRSRTGVLGGVHPSGYHPSWESGYGITSAKWTEDGRLSELDLLDAEGRMNRSGYKPAETFTTDELKNLQVEYDRQEGIRQKKLEKLAELRGMEDLNAGVRAPASQRVGANPAVGNIKPHGSGPLDFGDDALKRQYFEGLYT